MTETGKDFFEGLAKMVNRLCYGAAILFFMLGVMSVILQIFGRMTGWFSISWQEEIARYSFIGVTMFTSVIVVSKDEHLRVELLFNVLSKRMQNLLSLFIQAVGIVFLAGMSYLSYDTMLFNVKRYTPSTRISWSYVYAIVLAGCLLMIVQLVINIIKLMKERKNLPRGKGDEKCPE